jgi:hypothetical protein
MRSYIVFIFFSHAQMLEEREEEISKFREAEHDLSMSLDRVVYELQTDIQKSKQENSILQAKLQVLFDV